MVVLFDPGCCLSQIVFPGAWAWVVRAGPSLLQGPAPVFQTNSPEQLYIHTLHGLHVCNACIVEKKLQAVITHGFRHIISCGLDTGLTACNTQQHNKLSLDSRAQS